jgi:hypothetical protein
MESHLSRCDVPVTLHKFSSSKATAHVNFAMLYYWFLLRIQFKSASHQTIQAFGEDKLTVVRSDVMRPNNWPFCHASWSQMNPNEAVKCDKYSPNTNDEHLSNICHVRSHIISRSEHLYTNEHLLSCVIRPEQSVVIVQ